MREELLRRSQTQITSRDKAIEERDGVITKLEKDLVKMKIEQDGDIPNILPDKNDDLGKNLLHYPS